MITLIIQSVSWWLRSQGAVMLAHPNPPFHKCPAQVSDLDQASSANWWSSDGSPG